jgi:hypothetical protein
MESLAQFIRSLVTRVPVIPELPTEVHNLVVNSTVDSELLLEHVFDDVASFDYDSYLVQNYGVVLQGNIKERYPYVDHKLSESWRYDNYVNCFHLSALKGMGTPTPDGKLNDVQYSIMNRVGIQESWGFGIRPAEALFTLRAVAKAAGEEDQFIKNPIVQRLKYFFLTQNGYKPPFRFVKGEAFGGRVRRGEWKLAFHDVEGIPMYAETGVAHRVLLLLNMLTAWVGEAWVPPDHMTPHEKKCYDACLWMMDKLVWSDRRGMKDIKSEFQQTMKLIGNIDGPLPMALASSALHPTGGVERSVRVELYNSEKRKFMKEYSMMARDELKAKGELPPIYDAMYPFRVTPFSIKSLGLLESMIEMTGYRRGGEEGPTKDSSKADIQPGSSLLVDAALRERDLYVDLLKTGKAQLYPLTTTWDYVFSKENLGQKLLQYIKLRKSAGLGGKKFGIKEDVDDKGRRTYVVFDVDDDTEGKGIVRTTKKGPIAFASIPEMLESVFSDQVADSYMSLFSPAFVGFRYVPYKDPRLIFLFSLVLHLAMQLVIEMIHRAVRDNKTIFISDQGGTFRGDTSAYAEASCDGNTRVVMSLDWEKWDGSLQSHKTSGFSAALRTVLPRNLWWGSRRLPEFYGSLLQRSVSAMFQVDTAFGGPTMYPINRLLSGDPGTSIRGSVSNIAQSHAIAERLRTMFTDPRARRELLKDEGVDYVELLGDEKYEFPFIDPVKGITVMGDDLGISCDYSEVTPEKRGRIHFLLEKAFAIAAEECGGSMNASKQLTTGYLVVFVRKMYLAGQHVFRASTLLYQQERSEIAPPAQMFQVLLSRASEMVVRGYSPIKLNQMIVGLWAVVGRIGYNITVRDKKTKAEHPHPENARMNTLQEAGTVTLVKNVRRPFRGVAFLSARVLIAGVPFMPNSIPSMTAGTTLKLLSVLRPHGSEDDWMQDALSDPYVAYVVNQNPSRSQVESKAFDSSIKYITNLTLREEVAGKMVPTHRVNASFRAWKELTANDLPIDKEEVFGNWPTRYAKEVSWVIVGSDPFLLLTKDPYMSKPDLRPFNRIVKSLKLRRQEPELGFDSPIEAPISMEHSTTAYLIDRHFGLLHPIVKDKLKFFHLRGSSRRGVREQLISALATAGAMFDAMQVVERTMLSGKFQIGDIPPLCQMVGVSPDGRVAKLMSEYATVMLTTGSVDGYDFKDAWTALVSDPSIHSDLDSPAKLAIIVHYASAFLVGRLVVATE